MTDIAIRAEGLSKRFTMQRERRMSLKERVVRGRAPKGQEFWALRDVDFGIERGGFLGIIGHNGAGKSTALKVLAGIYRPTSGRVHVAGRVSALLELGAGFHPELTGRENIRMNGSILGFSRRQIDAVMDDIIEFAGIGRFIDSPVKIYSSGMAIRLGFSIAIRVEPDILIVDEVVAVGDEQFQRKCFDHLFQLKRRGVTIIMVSHSMPLMESMCDTVLWLDHGRVQRFGPAREVVQGYLDHVNTLEAESTTTTSTDQERRRSGTGELRTTGLSFIGAGDRPLGFVVYREPARLRIEYEAATALRRVDFTLSLVHESGVLIAEPSTRGGRPLTVEAGRGCVEFDMPDVFLKPGSYWVSTAVTQNGCTLDRIERGFVLKVRGSHLDGAGIAALPGTWTPPVAGVPEASHQQAVVVL